MSPTLRSFLYSALALTAVGVLITALSGGPVGAAPSPSGPIDTQVVNTPKTAVPVVGVGLPVPMNLYGILSPIGGGRMQTFVTLPATPAGYTKAVAQIEQISIEADVFDTSADPPAPECAILQEATFSHPIPLHLTTASPAPDNRVFVGSVPLKVVLAPGTNLVITCTSFSSSASVSGGTFSITGHVDGF